MAARGVDGRADGYSGTPLVRKLGLRPGLRVCLLHEPDGFRALLDGVEDWDLLESVGESIIDSRTAAELAERVASLVGQRR